MLKEEVRNIRSQNGKLTQALQRLKTDKQRRFVLEYNLCGDRHEAYRVVYNPVNVTSGLSKLLENKNVQECLTIVDSRNISQNELQKEEILLHLYYAVTRDVEDMIDDNGIIIKNLKQLTPRAKACIDSIEQKEFYGPDGEVVGVETKVRLIPKAKALEMAMKHKGLFAPEQHEHKHVVDFSNLPGAQDDDPVQQRIDAEYKRIDSQSAEEE